MFAPMTALAAATGRDDLGDRMKGYEAELRSVLPARSWVALRLDGCAFHSWTRGLARPYSLELVDAMGDVMRGLCERIPGVVCALQQSDELTLVIQDFSRAETQPWYGGQLQKIVSVSASMMTALFARHFPDRSPALFDARVFVLPNRIEVANALLWRQLDGRRNAISMLAESLFSSKQLHGVPTAERRRMITDAGVRLEDHDPRFLNGQFARQIERLRTSYVDKRTQETVQLPEPAVSHVWTVEAAPDLNAKPDGVLLTSILPADPAV